MAVWDLGSLNFRIYGNDTLRSPWRIVTGLGERINNHWTIAVLPQYAVQQVGFVDMGLHNVVPHARDEDRLTLDANGRFVLNIRGIEHIDASPTKTIDLEVVGKKGFTTDGSFNSVVTRVGHHEIFYTGATRDSTLYTGVGWDQIRLIDHPLVAGTQFWTVVRRVDGQVDAYSLYSGYRIRYEGGSTTWGNTSGRLNYGEVDEVFLDTRNRPAGDVWRPGNDVSETGDRGTFDNIDLSNAAVDTYIDRFIQASFKSIHYATQNLYVGTAIAETFNPVNGDTTGGTQSVSRDHITVNGNHHLIVDEEPQVIDGHLRLYVRNNESGLYNRFNEVYLGTSASNTDANDYTTTSENAYATVNPVTGQGATPVLGTAMFGFGGNDILTASTDVDYLLGGTSTFTTIQPGHFGNVLTGGDGADYFGTGNISTGVDGDVLMTTDFTARLAGTAPATTDPSGTLSRTGATETADLAMRVATDRIQDWTAGVDSLRVLANGTTIIDGLGTANGGGGGYALDALGSDAERVDISGALVNNEGKIVARGLGGNDTIIGSDGMDWLYGNSGNDVVLAGAVAAGDGNDRFYYDTYAGRLFAGGFDASDKVYLNKKVLDSITGTFNRSTEAANHLTANNVTLSGNDVFDTQNYTPAVAYNPQINFLHDVFYGPSGALPPNQSHINGPGFVDGSDNFADISTAGIGAGMVVIGYAIPFGFGIPLVIAGLALGAGGLAGGFLNWTIPHQHATYTGDIRGNYLTVLTAQNNVDTSVAVDGNANIDNVRFLDFFRSADAQDGYTPAIQFIDIDYRTRINQFFAVHSDDETFIYWVYSQDAIITNGDAVKIAEINGRLFAEDFAIYDGELDVYNYGTLEPIIIYTPSIVAVGYSSNADDVSEITIAEDAQVVVPGGPDARFILQGRFFSAIEDKTNPFTTTAGSATVTVAYANHGLATNGWIQITGAEAANGINFNGAYQITVVDANTFTFTANKFTEDTGVAGVTAGANVGNLTSFGVPGDISAGSTIQVYDGGDRLDADPLTAGDQVSVSVSGDGFILRDTRNLGTSLTQSPDGSVTFDSTDSRYEDALGNEAYLSVTNGSATVTVNYVNHNMQVGNSVAIVGATAAGGIDFNGTWVVASTNSNQFTFEAANTASSTIAKVNSGFSFTSVSAPVNVSPADIVATGGGVLRVTMAEHGMLSGDQVTFTSTFNAGNYLYSANTAYTVTRIDDTQFSITSTINNGGGTTTPNPVTFSVPNGGDQTFFLKDEKVSYFVEVTNADSGFEIMSLQYNFTVGGGTSILNGGRGTDSVVLSDESVALNGMADSQIVNLERIQISSDANDSLTLDLSNQTDGFEVYDSNAANSIIGSQGNDSIHGGGGQDTIQLNTGGNDQVQFSTGDAALGSNTDYDTINGMSAGDNVRFLGWSDRDGQSSRLMYETATLGANMTVASATELLVVTNSSVGTTGSLTDDIATALGSAFNLSGLDGNPPSPSTGGGSDSTSLFAVKSDQANKWWVGTYLDRGNNDLLGGDEIAVFGLADTPDIVNSFWQPTELAPQALTINLPSTIDTGAGLYTQSTTFSVSGLQPGNQVYYSLNGGSTWQRGAVDQTIIPLNMNQANDIRVRQVDGNNYSPETTSGANTITPVTVIWDEDSPTTNIGLFVFTSLGIYRDGTTTVNGLELPYFRSVGFDPNPDDAFSEVSGRIYFDFDDKADIDPDVWGPDSTSVSGGKYEIVNEIKVHDLDDGLGDYDNGLQPLGDTWWFTDQKGRLTINTDDFDGETRSGADTRLYLDLDIPLAGGGTQNFVFDGYIDWATGII